MREAATNAAGRCVETPSAKIKATLPNPAVLPYIFGLNCRTEEGTTDWRSGAEQKRTRRETAKLPAVEFYRKCESKTADLRPQRKSGIETI